MPLNNGLGKAMKLISCIIGGLTIIGIIGGVFMYAQKLESGVKTNNIIALDNKADIQENREDIAAIKYKQDVQWIRDSLNAIKNGDKTFFEAINIVRERDDTTSVDNDTIP